MGTKNHTNTKPSKGTQLKAMKKDGENE